jgi:hypothetical protein
MNSRRLMGTLSPRITPYHIALGIPLCRAAKSTRGWQLRVKRRSYLSQSHVCFRQFQTLAGSRALRHPARRRCGLLFLPDTISFIVPLREHDVSAQGNVVGVAAISTGHPLCALSLVWSSMGHPSVLGTMRNHTRPQGRRGACAVAGPSSPHAKMKPIRRALPRF